MKDILSLFVSNEVAFSFIKKTYRITLVLLICNITYVIFGLLEWYSYVQKIPARSHSIPHYFYYYNIWPAISLFALLVILAGSSLNYQSYGYLKTAIIKNDDNSLTAAFKNFYFSYSLFLISTITLLLDAGYRHFILNF